MVTWLHLPPCPPPSPNRYGWGGASALWTGFFIYSKLPELLDTVFIVLMKADLTFLQWCV
jgi:elongation of very long chain fatty acids protein 6